MRLRPAESVTHAGRRTGASVENAHPHVSCDGKIAVVHNGIIENFAELREELTAKGHHFRSETDTEVFAHLIEEAYPHHLSEPRPLVAAVREACTYVVGAYGLAAVCADEPGSSRLPVRTAR